jgi:DNA-binding NarL/FixJ family response regulator
LFYDIFPILAIPAQCGRDLSYTVFTGLILKNNKNKLALRVDVHVCASGMKKHILLIEQNRHDYYQFMNALHSINIECKVTYTSDVEHALQMLQYLSPDCIFMRMDISEENSIDCVKKIHNRIATNETKLIVYDDEVTGRMIRRSITQGADYCIDRPCTFADFNHLLKDIFKLN